MELFTWSTQLLQTDALSVASSNIWFFDSHLCFFFGKFSVSVCADVSITLLSLDVCGGSVSVLSRSKNYITAFLEIPEGYVWWIVLNYRSFKANLVKKKKKQS